jgi:phosphatidate cytidylyltransferase
MGAAPFPVTMSAPPASDAPAPAPATAAPAASPGKLKVFAKRLSSTLVLWALLATAMVFNVPWPFFILVGVLGLGALWEYLQMDKTVPRPFRLWAIALGCAYYAVTFVLAWRNAGHGRMLELGWLDLAGAILAVTGPFYLTLVRPLEGRQTLWNILYPAFGFFYVAYLFSFVTRLIFSAWPDASGRPDENAGTYYALFVIAATKLTDSGAYAFGSLIGRHKMIPHISPGKTWEGLSGAFTGAYVGGMCVKWACPDKVALLSTTAALVLCFLITILCVVGDLAESIVKRCLGVKDSGKTLPGIGGAFDLIDSLLFTVPVVYLYLRYVA